MHGLQKITHVPGMPSHVLRRASSLTSKLLRTYDCILRHAVWLIILANESPVCREHIAYLVRFLGKAVHTASQGCFCPKDLHRTTSGPICPEATPDHGHPLRRPILDVLALPGNLCVRLARCFRARVLGTSSVARLALQRRRVRTPTSTVRYSANVKKG
ncbi:hypothetical protein PLICRDRAFT_246577 [Plicaturopsis crispa FD-325 SS-3]|nr:hypothetical protein PLICRDRAFT_246577 [Plicaturopsis crispa FD-325 SS-3]